MGRPNPPPQPECCRQPGQAPASSEGEGAERTAGGVHRDRSRPQAGVASGLSYSASKRSTADGEGVILPEPNTSAPVTGEGVSDLPGSKRVAWTASVEHNLGGPRSSCRSNYGNQAGRGVQRQGVLPEEVSGVRCVHRSREQDPWGPDPGEGTHSAMRSAQETSPVRLTDSAGPPHRRLSKARSVALKSPVREYCTPGSVRGAPGNRRPYRDHRMPKAGCWREPFVWAGI